MSHGHVFRFTCDFGREEFEVLVKYNFVPGVPARIRYDENDYPAEAPEIDIYDMTIQNNDSTWRSVSKEEFNLIDLITMENYFDEMVEVAS